MLHALIKRPTIKRHIRISVVYVFILCIGLRVWPKSLTGIEKYEPKVLLFDKSLTFVFLFFLVVTFLNVNTYRSHKTSYELMIDDELLSFNFVLLFKGEHYN
ncbi:hypothetical protein HanIR_Chr03g0145111 [Helianthus annuus]|nr:hypothetical protein HanIR_Chr03g0145111 [Helianthus annuus]